MPKRFLFFLLTVQVIICATHWLLYQSFLFFFPGLVEYRAALAITFTILSVGFLGISLLTFRRENWLLRILYIIFAIWMPTWFYLIVATIVSFLLYLVLNRNLAAWFYAAAFLLTLYGIINARITRVKQITIVLPNLPDYWKNKTAVLASDIHLGHVLKQGFAGKVVSHINKLNPDIVFIPGDFYDGVKTNFQELANEFKNIKAPLGTYFCSGNHEMFAGYQTCETALKNAGIKILENGSVDIQGLQIAGVAYKKETMTDLAQILQNLHLDKTKPSILLKHVPAQFAEVESAGFNFMLAGHSHHGQIWPGRIITEKYWRGFDYGLKIFKSLQIYISSGVGTWGPPMRIGTNPEIVKITFQ